MRLPFQKKKDSGTRYSLIDPDISDSDTEDESVVFQKKFGHVELNLVPRHIKIRKAKTVNRLKCAYLFLAIVLISGSVITLALFIGKHFFIDHNTNTTVTSTSVNQTGLSSNWKKTYKHTGGEGGIRLIDVDGDGVDDIILGAVDSDRLNDVISVDGNKFDDLHRYCKLKELDYPCVGSIIALRGSDGQELWRFNTRSEVFLTICDVDLNGDGLLDCISTGRQSSCVAFDPRKGEVLWMSEDDTFMAATWNIYQALALEDWDNDGVRDILIVNGGDPVKDPEDHDRKAGRAIMLSGATGKPLGNRYLEMPDNKESYMSPSLYSPSDGSAPYVLFGSGGETMSGDLLAITIEDLCRYIMEDKSSNCPHFEGQPVWGHRAKDHSGFIQIYKGKKKGVMVPPVIVDVNKDGVGDLVLSAYDGAVILFDGKSLDPMWTADFSGMESYSSPAPGYFDDDDTLDFMVHWCEGAWDTYTGSNTTVLSGKDGHILWNLDSAFMQMTSDLSLKTNVDNLDMFVYRVQGRGSKFRWDKEGQITRGDQQRHKRHGGGSKRPLDNGTIQELLDANYTWDDAVMSSYEQHHLSCRDDLDTFKGEVFLMDRTNSHNPLRIINMPAEKYSYELPDKDPQAERYKILKQLYPDKYKDGEVPPSGIKTHLSGKFMPDNDNHDNDDIPDGDYDDDGVDDDGGDDGDDDNDDGHEDSLISGRKHRHDGIAIKGKLCTVAFYDARTTGAIGDLDGDGMLDYVSVLPLMIGLVDENYSYSSTDYDIVIQKISFEKEALEGTLTAVPVMADAVLKDSPVGHKFDKKVGIFRPLGEQTWSAFMGKSGNSIA